jgi:N-succinyldiaminopimelate aminotransferase
VLPSNGSREALPCLRSAWTPRVQCARRARNLFYQIYVGAAPLAGAQPVFLNQDAATGYALPLDSLAPDEWPRVQPLWSVAGNPSGRVALDEWRALPRSRRPAGFVIASDECYSRSASREAAPPMGALEAWLPWSRRLVAPRRLHQPFQTIARTCRPALGAVAGDARLLQQFLRYRTYHGCAMSLRQEASIAAWEDEAHAPELALHREKFDAVGRCSRRSSRQPRRAYPWMPVPVGDDSVRAGSGGPRQRSGCRGVGRGDAYLA